MDEETPAKDIPPMKKNRMSYSREVLDTFITSGEAKLVGELPPLSKKNQQLNFNANVEKKIQKYL
jgi:hypothetical protein